MDNKIIKDLYCFQCSLQFDKKAIYDIHLKIMHNYKNRTDYFLTDIKKEPENELQIESSNISTTSVRIQIERKIFSCTHCDKIITTSYGLKKHERIHTGEKLFSCDYCDKKFGRSTVLKEHKRIHTGEKPFSCKHCDKKFSSSANSKVHERIHTGETPFSCKFCDKSFSQSQNLKTHEKIHSGETSS